MIPSLSIESFFIKNCFCMVIFLTFDVKKTIGHYHYNCFTMNSCKWLCKKFLSLLLFNLVWSACDLFVYGNYCSFYGKFLIINVFSQTIANSVRLVVNSVKICKIMLSLSQKNLKQSILTKKNSKHLKYKFTLICFSMFLVHAYAGITFKYSSVQFNLLK